MQHIYIDRLSPFVWHTSIHGSEFGIRWYGLAYLASFALMYFFFRRAALRGDIPGLDIPEVDNLAIRIIAGVMIGGRLGYVVQHLDILIHDPVFLIRIWGGGMAFFGGLAGVIIAIWTFARKHQFNYLALTDVCALPAALGLGIGRIANFVNGELFGKPTHANWGVIFPRTDFVARHPSQLYESATHFLLFAILFFLYPRWVRRGRPGFISFLFLLGYGLLRFLTDFYRQDDTYWSIFSDGQWFSLGVAAGGAICLYRWFKTQRDVVQPSRNEKV